jgi:cyclopropane fatty-acyl-phospholipid synthase-like methyltransferase
VNTVWDEIFRKGDFWKDPHPEIGQMLALFDRQLVRRVLDLGSGAGRHLVTLAENGYEVYGLDCSVSGHSLALKTLAERGLWAHLTLHDMQQLPYEDNFFDAVISIQVIHHNTLSGITQTIVQITRVLKAGGLIWITLPASKNEPSKRQEEIEPGTFVPFDGPEKGLPHHYFRKDELAGLFPGFRFLDLHVDQINHFSLVAQKVSPEAP